MLQSTLNQQTVTALSAMANTSGVKIPGLSSDPTASHWTSLAELVALQAGWSPACPFQRGEMKK